jgi:D-alanyl-D-alanine carboxypeptidase
MIIVTKAARAFFVCAGVAGLASCMAGPSSRGSISVQSASAVQWAELDSLFRSAFESSQPGAAVIIVHDGRVAYRGALGLAHTELGVPLQPEMVFPIGSVTKQFTAVATLILAQEGRIALSDPIAKYLPDYPLHDRTVTIEHLLGHTSGIPDYPWAHSTEDVTIEELITSFQDLPFDFQPGERWGYSNSGYILLGAIIERVTGFSWDEVVRSRIAEPLGMNATLFAPDRVIVPGRVSGYEFRSGQWRNAYHVNMTHVPSSGGLLSSIDDLGIWGRALISRQVLQPEMWDVALSMGHLTDGTPTRYGAGWYQARIADLETWEHGGGLAGFGAHTIYVPEKQLFAALLMNARPSPANPLQLLLEMTARVAGVAIEAEEIQLDADRLDNYIGSYRHGEEDVRRIYRAGDRIYSRRGEGREYELYPIADNLFAMKDGGGARLRFIRSGNRIIAVDYSPRLGMDERAQKID